MGGRSGAWFVRLVFLLGGLLFAVILAVLVWAATRPSDFRVERRLLVQAPPEKVYALIEDVRRWPDWVTMEMKDPTLQRRYFGPARGAGSGFDWSGRPESGQGRTTITEAVAPRRVVLQVWVREPHEDKQTVEVNLRPGAGGTEVHWATYGALSYFMRVTTAFTSMEAVMAPELDRSLANLKALAER